MRIATFPVNRSSSNSRRPGGRRPVSGFTLVELVAVVTLLAVLAAVVSVRLGAPHGKAVTEHGVARFTQLEHLLRSHARRVGQPAELVIDLDEGIIERTDLAKRRPVGPPLRLGGRVRIDLVVTADGHQRDHGKLRIYVSPDGQTETYALRFTGPGDKRRWLVVAGVTGQVRRVGDEEEIKKIFALLRPSGLHSD